MEKKKKKKKICTILQNRNVSCVSKESWNVKEKKKISLSPPRARLFAFRYPPPYPAIAVILSCFDIQPASPRSKAEYSEERQLECGSWLHRTQFEWMKQDLFFVFFFTELVICWLEGLRENVIFRKLHLGNKTAYKCVTVCAVLPSVCSGFTPQGTHHWLSFT